MRHLISLRFQVEPPSSTVRTARRCGGMYWRFSAFKTFLVRRPLWNFETRNDSRAGRHIEFIRMCFKLWDATKRSCSLPESSFSARKQARVACLCFQIQIHVCLSPCFLCSHCRSASMIAFRGTWLFCGIFCQISLQDKTEVWALVFCFLLFSISNTSAPLSLSQDTGFLRRPSADEVRAT